MLRWFAALSIVLVAVISSLKTVEGTSALVAANNRFGIDLYARLQAANPNANVIISPTSLTVDLETAYEGARGATAAGMATALQLGSLNQSATAEEARALRTALTTGNGSVNLAIADALFDRQGFAFQPSFLRTAKQDFGAKASTLNFNSPQGVERINGWVNQETHGTIPKILNRVDPRVVMYMLNAIYFHAGWANPFPAPYGRDGSFTEADGRLETVHYMRTDEPFQTATADKVRIVALPYAGGRYQMDVVLPPAGTSLARFAARLTTATWNRWMSNLGPSEGDWLDLPRFTVSGSFTLNRTLEDMGMKQAFSRLADLSGLCASAPCRISKVVHRSYLSVGELGTTASAATAVGSVPMSASAEISVDRPFLLAIRDTTTGALLFFGGMANPTPA